MEAPIRIGISACLLGQNVRYNGGHKLDRFLRDTLGAYVQYVPVCPEVECGLPVPREAMRLVGDPEAPRLLTTRTGIDHTDRMLSWARRRVSELASEELCGFVFKSGSPSSGLSGVRVYNPSGPPVGRSAGLFARTFLARLPLVPVVDDTRMHDPALRERFVEQIFVMRRWRRDVVQGRGAAPLVRFHAQHKLLLLSHSPLHLASLGKLVARAGTLPRAHLLRAYHEGLLRTLRSEATVKKHTNVLLRLLGRLKRELSGDEKQELLDLIDAYRGGLVPLIVPVTLLSHYVRKYDPPGLREQHYLRPHPLELCLRNHV